MHTLTIYGIVASLISLLDNVDGHATITRPATRLNPTSSGGYCQWCQGSQEFCQGKPICAPPTPCWGSIGPGTVDPKYFSTFKNLMDPEGNLWVDPLGGPSQKTVWCPGKSYTISGYINADHNGVYRWESQLGEAGQEKEDNFKNFTSWTSINQDINTQYYKEGTTLWPKGTCFNEREWNYNVPHCMDGGWFQTNLTIPATLPVGNTIFRWIWFGAMDENQTHYENPEHSLFVNCVDIAVGDKYQCAE